MKKRFLLLAALLVGSFGLTFAQVDVTATAGNPAATYATLGAAFNAINDGTHQGDVDVRITANITEINTVTLFGPSAPANYTSVVIGPGPSVNPAVGVTVSMSAQDTLLRLQGASNVTIDGRVGGSGSDIALFFFNSSVGTAPIKAMAMAVTNGSTNCTMQYVEFDGATQAIPAGVVVELSGTGNNDITFDNCVFFNGRTLLNVLGGGTTYTVSNSSFYDFGFNGIFSNSTHTTINIENCDMAHLFNLSNGNPVGMVLSPLAGTAATFNIENNLIVQLGTSAIAGNVGAINLVPAATGNPTFNLVNNMISLMLANSTVSAGATNGLRGIWSPVAANPAVFNYYFNTVRLGGTSPAGTGINSFCYGNFNSAAGSVLRFFNNIAENVRTGAGRSNVGAWHRFDGSVVNYSVAQLNYNYYYGSPFQVTTLSTSTSSISGYQTLIGGGREANSVLGTTALSFVSNTNPSLSGASLSDVNLVGSPIVGITTDRFGTVRNALVPYKGAFEGPGFPTNAQAVRIIHTLGKIAQFNAAPHHVRAIVRNNSVLDKTDYPVYLNVTGANSFMDTVVVGSLPAGQQVTVEFAPYVNTNMGSNNVAVYIDADDTPADDSINVNQDVSANSFNYAYRTPPAVAPVPFGGLGLGANPTGAMVARFRIDQPSFVNQVKVDFTAGGADYQVGLWSVANNPAPNDTPEVLLYSTATLTSVAGQAIVNIDPPVAVNGDFFVGVIQPTVSSVSFAYQQENPIRNDRTFYFRFNSSAPWNDFGVNPANTFRFMIEPRLQLAEDIATVALAAPVTTACRTAAEDVTFTIQNVGSDPIDFTTNPITVNGSVTGPNATTFTPVTINSGTLASGATMDVNVSTNYDMSAPGTYNFQAEITSLWDINTENNTLPSPVAIQSLIRSNTNTFGYDFTGFTGANLATVRPGWREGFGNTTPLGTTSDWVASNVFGQTTAAINNFGTANRDWIVLPPFTCGPNTGLKFKAAVTAFGSAAASPLGMSGSDDVVRVLVSTDCGATFTPIFTIDGSTGLGNTFQEFNAYVGDVYDGQEIMFAIFASDGVIDDANDYDFHIDDVQVANLNPVELSMLEVQNIGNGCNLSASTPVTVLIRNEGLPLAAGFDFDVRYRTKVANAYITENVVLASTLNTGDTLTYTFATDADLSAAGRYRMRVEVLAAGDPIANNNFKLLVFDNAAAISTLPYRESFESGGTGWFVEGTNTSWERGAPAGTIINSAADGNNAWVTNLTGNYGNNERGSVNSPCFDFSTLVSAPYFSMSIFRASENLWDGAQFQYSIDNGATWINVGTTSNPDWYNSASIADASVRAFFNLNQNWWTGDGTGWQRVQIQLPNAVVGQSNVRFRVAFASDVTINQEGFAFDDVAINALQPNAVAMENCGFTDGVIGGLQAGGGARPNFVRAAQATNVVGIPVYQFEVRNGANTVLLGTISQRSRRINFEDFPGIFTWNTSYNIRVRVSDNNITSAWSASCPFSIGAEPMGVNDTEIRPEDCGGTFTIAGVTNNIRLDYALATPVARATSYDFEISDAADLNVLGVVTSNSSGKLRFADHLGIFTWGTSYTVRVRANIGTVSGTFGNPCIVNIMVEPNPATLPTTRLATCGGILDPVAGTLRAIRVANAGNYHYFFYTDAACTNLHGVAIGGLRTLAGNIVPGLAPGTDYYVIVRATVGNVFTNPGDTCMITTTGVAPRLSANALGINAYPNPFTSEVSVVINHPTVTTANVRIFDMAGRLVANQVLQTNAVNLIGSGLATGTYIVEAITADGEKQVLRIVKSN